MVILSTREWEALRLRIGRLEADVVHLKEKRDLAEQLTVRSAPLTKRLEIGYKRYGLWNAERHGQTPITLPQVLNLLLQACNAELKITPPSTGAIEVVPKT